MTKNQEKAMADFWEYNPPEVEMYQPKKPRYGLIAWSLAGTILAAVLVYLMID